MTYDCSQITERLYIGANVNGPQDVIDLRALGITHVIDANIDDEKPLFNLSGIAILSDPTADDGQPKQASWFAPAIDFGVGCISHPGFKLLTHCAAGVNRGPSLGYAILRALGGFPGPTLALIHDARPVTVGGIRYWQDADKALVTLGWLR